MFDHTSVEVLPLRSIGEYGCCSQERSINRFDPWPPHQLSCYKGFDEVAGRKFSSIQGSSQNFVLVQFKFLQSGVHEPMVQHVRLFVVMGGKNNVVDDVFECLRSPDQVNSIIPCSMSLPRGFYSRRLLSTACPTLSRSASRPPSTPFDVVPVGSSNRRI